MQIEENKSMQLFQSQEIRTQWNNKKELWYFSIVDVVLVLASSKDYQTARKYWNKLKQRLKEEGNEMVTNCHQLKLKARDGKMRFTDVADTEQLLRLIQSIPSPNAEPFKQWLAQVGYERLEAIADPEKSINRTMEDYLNLGYSKDWINQRLKSIEVRKDLTDEWEKRAVVKEKEFATLTDIITKAWSGNTTKEYKNLKGLKKENLRDNISNLELVLNMLAEATTTEISKEKKPENLDENKTIAKKGGTIAGDTRVAIEQQTGKKIVTSINAKKLLAKE